MKQEKIIIKSEHDIFPNYKSQNNFIAMMQQRSKIVVRL